MALARIASTAIPPFIYGADPELFLEVDGKIIGSEKVVPEEKPKQIAEGVVSAPAQLVVRDGVQVELHPSPAGCRVQVGGNLAISFGQLASMIKEANNKRIAAGLPLVKVCWQTVMPISKDEIDSLSDASKKFGCQESLNIYGDNPDLSQCNAETYPFRAAGGHIHIGLGTKYVDQQAAARVSEKYQTFLHDYWSVINLNPKKAQEVLDKANSYRKTEEYTEAMRTIADRERYPADPLIKLLDVIVGNTGVMLDRDPLAEERRRWYGRAGEYRLPDHGYEYRVLSNWWLRSYPLMSLVMGLTRLAGSIQTGAGTTFDLKPTSLYADKLLSMVDLEKVRRAINENNLLLAKANWKIVKDFISKHVADLKDPQSSHILPLGPNVLEDFEYFLAKGVDYWFPPEADHLTAWTSRWSSLGGWETYLTKMVRADRRKAKENAERLSE